MVNGIVVHMHVSDVYSSWEFSCRSVKFVMLRLEAIDDIVRHNTGSRNLCSLSRSTLRVRGWMDDDDGCDPLRHGSESRRLMVPDGA